MKRFFKALCYVMIMMSIIMCANLFYGTHTVYAEDNEITDQESVAGQAVSSEQIVLQQSQSVETDPLYEKSEAAAETVIITDTEEVAVNDAENMEEVYAETGTGSEQDAEVETVKSETGSEQEAKVETVKSETGSEQEAKVETVKSETGSDQDTTVEKAGLETVSTADAKAFVTIQNGIDYSLVYDFNYFQNKYPDVRAAFGDDDVATLANFVRWGMEGQRQGIATFDEVSYRYAYVDLRQAYGQNYAQYYLHYIKYGYQEGRSLTTGITTIQNPVTVQNGLDYSAVYDYDYFSANPDVKEAFGDDDVATLANFVRWGIPSGRLGNDSFDVSFYANKYKSTLGSVYGDNLNAYCKHYILWGQKAGLVGTHEEDTKFTAESGEESIVSYSNLDSIGRNVYYLFFMNDMSLEDVSLSVSLIDLQNSSVGQVVPTENRITGISVANGQEISVSDTDGNNYALIFMKSSLRSVSIQLNGTDLKTISAGSKDIKYEGNEITFIDNDLNAKSYTDVEIKGRGDSTWQNKDKLPFQIKLSKKQSVFGMDKAKKWILLANAYDDTLSRNAIAYTAAQQLGVDGSVDFEYCNLWIDGEFQGNYIICEKAEIGDGRVELENEEGALFELNNVKYWEDPYFTETDMGYVTVKELVNDDDEETMAYKVLDNFKTKVSGLFNYLTNVSEPTLSGLGQYIDVESFAQYYLIADYFMCWEATDVSAYFYQDGADDVIHFGPVWDYDCSMGNYKWNLSDSDRYEASNSTVLSALIDTKCFREYLQQYYIDHKDVFWRTASVNTENYMLLLTTNAAKMNFVKNPIFGQESLKSNIKTYQTSWWEAYHQVDVWLKARIKIYDPVLGRNSFMDVKRDGTELIIRCNYSSKFDLSLWMTEDDGENMVLLTNGQRQDDGSYIFVYSLTDIRTAGRITIHMNAYDGNTSLPSAFYYCRLKPFVSEGMDYSPVFNPVYYWNAHPELQTIYTKDDEQSLFQHFLNWGMAAGWQASAEFNFNVYRINYPELIGIYGNDYIMYYLHYIRWGRDSHLKAA